MATVEEYVQDHHQRIGGIEEVLNSLQGKVSKLKEEKLEDLPWYFAKTPMQMQEELEKQGVFTKEQPGLQDDFDNAFRLFTQVNERGELIQGLTGARGPTSLIELYQTMDLRGLIWNYGLGWISALKGGYNIGAESGRDNAKKIIEKVREFQIPNSKDLLENLKYSDQLENYYETREWNKKAELEIERKFNKNVINRRINEIKGGEKQAYFNLLKLRNDIREFKVQQRKPKPYWV